MPTAVKRLCESETNNFAFFGGGFLPELTPSCTMRPSRRRTSFRRMIHSGRLILLPESSTSFSDILLSRLNSSTVMEQLLAREKSVSPSLTLYFLSCFCGTADGGTPGTGTIIFLPTRSLSFIFILFKSRSTCRLVPCFLAMADRLSPRLTE